MVKPRQYKKKVGAGKRKYRKKAKMYRSIGDKIYTFKRWTSPNNMTLQNRANAIGSFNTSNGYWIPITNAAAAAPAYYSFAVGFCLADLPDYTDFTTLFDQYMICGIKFRIFNVATGTESPSTVTYTNGGFIHMAPDYDDINAPATTEAGINELRCKPNFKSYNIASRLPAQVFIRPRLITGVYGAGVFTNSAIATKRQWLDCNSISVQHNGIKGVIEIVQNGAAPITHNLKVEACYYLAFKGTI